MINVGLLAVILIAALTLQEEEVSPATPLACEMPKFNEAPITQELPVMPSLEMTKPVEVPLAVVEEPLAHQLPPLLNAEGRTQNAERSGEAPAAPIAAPVMAPVQEVVVKKGDNLEKIARAHRTTVDEIIKINHLPNSFLKVGQVLKIPAERSVAAATKPAEKKPSQSGPEYYTMKVGDNPWAIAMKHHMKVEELLRLNGLNEERARKLKPGDRLRIR